MIELFAELEKKQLEFLDEAAKRIIELVSALLGLLFAVIAFGNAFPPPYLAGNVLLKVLSISALGGYLGALMLALWGVQPRRYKHYQYNLKGMREELDAMLAHKMFWMRWAGGVFGVASVLLAGLIVLVLVQA
ncbi:hypothetical protein EYB53_022135 [Candidatus Chloroploca sp. M-50]|uniref:Uncharacterized protein n=1 Tax=Candidatus Chloroploca mongolica TaxID=2528176 RepID=A0ABS4DG64_9CHLR|nr:hypothetical protein [Candidatus Chloroploca mongolica]MBP1466201.1 hypothetical protein [Candidatus Chloroploca mongolica]MBP1468428.1 hypothetical protein [Candidatus Chloroploca mongolica]